MSSWVIASVAWKVRQYILSCSPPSISKFGKWSSNWVSSSVLEKLSEVFLIHVHFWVCFEIHISQLNGGMLTWFFSTSLMILFNIKYKIGILWACFFKSFKNNLTFLLFLLIKKLIKTKGSTLTEKELSFYWGKCYQKKWMAGPSNHWLKPNF